MLDTTIDQGKSHAKTSSSGSPTSFTVNDKTESDTTKNKKVSIPTKKLLKPSVEAADSASKTTTTNELTLKEKLHGIKPNSETVTVNISINNEKITCNHTIFKRKAEYDLSGLDFNAIYNIYMSISFQPTVNGTPQITLLWIDQHYNCRAITVWDTKIFENKNIISLLTNNMVYKCFNRLESFLIHFEHCMPEMTCNMVNLEPFNFLRDHINLDQISVDNGDPAFIEALNSSVYGLFLFTKLNTLLLPPKKSNVSDGIITKSDTNIFTKDEETVLTFLKKTKIPLSNKKSAIINTLLNATLFSDKRDDASKRQLTLLVESLQSKGQLTFIVL